MASKINIFTPKNQANTDEVLIAESLAGNKKSLETLIKRYQDYVFNISLKMYLQPDDALDATQEVLIKVITSLKTFNNQSKFSTWLYRITVNHFLNSPIRKMEKMFEKNFEMNTAQFADNDTKEVSEEEIEEVRVLCSTAMLLCLNREQRLIYIIGEIFGADHTVGAELFGITPANFRVKLHRAKADLVSYVSGKCGLINPKNPCRCNKKAKQMVAQGLVDKGKMQFHTHYQQKINQIVLEKKDAISDEIQLGMLKIFQDSPFQVRNELAQIFDSLV